MLTVRTKVRPSAISGVGCFAAELIPCGAIVWVYDERIDNCIPVDDLSNLPQAMQEFLSIYGYEETQFGRQVIVLCGDHSKHMNHSADPNVVNFDANSCAAARDIQPGEELTCDYYSFDAAAANKLRYQTG